MLVVDDSAAFRQRVTRHLNEADGIVVVGEARDGLAALQEVERLRPDIVLLDLHMPGADGFRVLHDVKLRFPLTAVIVLTSDASEMARQRCAALGADAVIDKGDAAAYVVPAMRKLAAGQSRQDSVGLSLPSDHPPSDFAVQSAYLDCFSGADTRRCWRFGGQHDEALEHNGHAGHDDVARHGG